MNIYVPGTALLGSLPFELDLLNKINTILSLFQIEICPYLKTI